MSVTLSNPVSESVKKADINNDMKILVYKKG